MSPFLLTNSLSQLVSIITRLSTSQSLSSMSAISSLSFAPSEEDSPVMTKLETTLVSFCELLVGPERSHPSLILTAVGPKSPRIDSPVTKSQEWSKPIKMSIEFKLSALSANSNSCKCGWSCRCTLSVSGGQIIGKLSAVTYLLSLVRIGKLTTSHLCFRWLPFPERI